MTDCSKLSDQQLRDTILLLIGADVGLEPKSPIITLETILVVKDMLKDAGIEAKKRGIDGSIKKEATELITDLIKGLR